MDTLRVVPLVAFAVASKVLSGARATFALLGTWLIIPLIPAVVLFLATIDLNDFPWFVKFGLVNVSTLAAGWIVYGLLLLFTSTGPIRIRQMFAKISAVFRLGPYLILGGLILLIGPEH